MAKQTIAQQANALITLYRQLYFDKYGDSPLVNRYRERWGFQSMIEDLGYERSQRVIEFYLETDSNHQIPDLLRRYDRLSQRMTELEEDEALRAELRRATERRVKEWENGNK